MRLRVLTAVCFGLLLSALITAAEAARRPVGEATYRQFSRFYQYDANLPLNAQVLNQEDRGSYVLEKVTFASTHDKVVPAYLALPKGRSQPVPCLVFLHGYGGNKEDINELAPLIINTGRALLTYDAEYHGERALPGADVYSPLLYRNRDALIQTVVDGRRAIDYLVSRPEIDAHRIGLVGISMGGILGGVFAAVEPRIKATVLLVAGADWGLLTKMSQHPRAQELRALQPNLDYDRLADIMAPVDPLNFVSHIAPRPLLMQNGRNDDIVPPATNRLLFAAARQPKELDWYDSGHALPEVPVAFRVLSWLDKHL